MDVVNIAQQLFHEKEQSQLGRATSKEMMTYNTENEAPSFTHRPNRSKGAKNGRTQ